MNTNTKKKLYISCPMKGRAEEAIQHDMERMHRVAEAVFNQELEVIPIVIENDPPKGVNWPIWYLGESIKKMAEADYFIGVVDAYGARGCRVEAETAEAYEIPTYFVSAYQFMPEVNEAWVQQHAGRVNVTPPCCTAG